MFYSQLSNRQKQFSRIHECILCDRRVDTNNVYKETIKYINISFSSKLSAFTNDLFKL